MRPNCIAFVCIGGLLRRGPAARSWLVLLAPTEDLAYYCYSDNLFKLSARSQYLAGCFDRLIKDDLVQNWRCLLFGLAAHHLPSSKFRRVSVARGIIAAYSMMVWLDFLVCMFRHLYLTLMGHCTFIN